MGRLIEITSASATSKSTKLIDLDDFLAALQTRSSPGLGGRGIISFGQQLEDSILAYDGVSWHFACMSEVPYAAVRACIRHQGSSAYTHDAIAFAPSSSIASPTPTGAWTIGAFNGAASATIPARLADSRPSHTYTDWAPVSSIAHSSGLYPVHTRSFITTGPFSYSGGSTAIAQWKESAADPLIRGRYALCAAAVGNFVASNQAGFTVFDDTISLSPVLELEVLTAKNVMTFCGVGDSNLWGAGGSLHMIGAGHLACAALSSSEKPIFWQNAGCPSTTTSQSTLRLRDMLAAGSRPQAVIYQSFSRNDGTPTASTIAVNRANLYAVLDMCKQYGIIPIIDTGSVETAAAWNATADNFRKAWKAEVLTLGSLGIITIDSDTPVSDDATPARYVPRMTTDGTHFSDAGQAAIFSSWLVAMKTAMLRYFP